MTDIRPFFKIILTFLAIVSSLFAFIYYESKVIVACIILFVCFCSFIAIKIEASKSKKIETKLKQKNHELLAENQKLRKKTCQRCKMIYAYMIDESLSLDENFDKCFFRDDERSDKEGVIYYLDKYIYIDFSSESDDKECYLIDLISGLIYFPIDKWKESKRNEILLYRRLCSNRENHLNPSQLL